MSNSNRNFNKTGLTFSISDVNFDSNSLDLVPIHLNSPKSEELKPVIEKYIDPLLNIHSTIGSEYYSTINFVDSLPEIQKEVDSNVMFNEQCRNFDESVQAFTSFPNNLPANSIYEDISYYWFYCVIINGLAEWKPFSIKDSQRIEMKYAEIIENTENKFLLTDDCVPTDGGRYDVFINKRQKLSVYWEEAPMEIRRASWFYRPEDESFYIPYSELECEQLETQFKNVLENNKWNQPFELNVNPLERCLEDRFVFHSPNTMVEYRRYGYISGADNVMRGRVVYRGVEGFRNHLEPGESDNIDHVLFVIHGIGSVCDMAGRGIVECAQIMKNVSGKMLQSHFPQHNGRIELLPVSWHSKLHSETSSVDRDLSKITLKSVPKLRNFTNNALIDVLCYSSPTYCQTILTIVSAEMNRLRHLFVSRNPQYDGAISIVGHSLGAMIAFDLISLQDPDSVHCVPLTDIVAIPRLEFDIGHLFALGSPISLLLTARGLSVLGQEFQLSRCRGFFNIFHPFDPVAYRMEPMLVPEAGPVRPVVIPHHKGRKRLHLELKDNLVRVSQDIKSRLVQTLRNTWSSLQEFATAHAGNTELGDELGDNEMIRVLNKIDGSIGDRDDVDSTANEIEIAMGQLNSGKRIDYVLQEAPLESFNDYLFALGSHACYWDSEDTVLMMLKEIYVTLNIHPETKPHDSSSNNIIKPPHSRSVSNTTRLPPIIPIVSPHQTVSNSPLPPTFPTIQNKQYFIPNFNSEHQSVNEQSDLTVREYQDVEPLPSFNASEKQPQSAIDLLPPLLCTANELSSTTQGNRFNSDCLDQNGKFSSFTSFQNDISLLGSQLESDNCREKSDLLDIHNRPPFCQFKGNFQPSIISDRQDATPLYPPPPVMMMVPNNEAAFTHSQCYVSSTNHYLLNNSSNNLIQKPTQPIHLQGSLPPAIPTLSKTTFYPSEESTAAGGGGGDDDGDNQYQISTRDSFHIPNQLNIETSPPIESVPVGIPPPAVAASFTNYLSSPPLIEQFQSIISSNSSLSTQSNVAQPNDLLSNYFQSFPSRLPEATVALSADHLQQQQQHLIGGYFTANHQSVIPANNHTSETITSRHTTEQSNLFDTNPQSDSRFYGNYLAALDDDCEINRFSSSARSHNGEESDSTVFASESAAVWKSASPHLSLEAADRPRPRPQPQPKPKKSNQQDLAAACNENYSRTPSPRIFNQTPRNQSPKSILPTVAVAGRQIFGSKPLMPQSGKLFKKK